MVSQLLLTAAVLQGLFTSAFAKASVNVVNSCPYPIVNVGNDGGSYSDQFPGDTSGELLRVGVPGRHAINISKGANVQPEHYGEFSYIFEDDTLSYDVSLNGCENPNNCITSIKVETNEDRCTSVSAPTGDAKGHCAPGALGPTFLMTVTVCG